jgi:uncharacterized protein YndB with AHSA1/START domain
MADKPDLEIVRVFDAPRERVWKEWTDPEAFADWYGGEHADMVPESVEMDVREGGAWKGTMNAERGEIFWAGEYLEVDEPERLVFTVTDQPDSDERDVVTVVLKDLGDDGTEMVMQQSGGHMPPEGYERAKQGWGTFFDRMDARLSG